MGGVNDLVVVAVVIAMIAVASFAVGFESDREGYKRGQIDAINGIIKYELRKEDDGEMKWAEKD